MISIIIGLMTACALAAVAYPYFRRETEQQGDETEWQLRELLAAKNTIYSTLKELDFDRLAGKLSEEDFRQLEAQYRERAILVLREIDELLEERERTENLDTALSETLEGEILALRKATEEAPGPVGAAEEASPPAGDALDNPPEPRFCANCGVPVSSTDKFCSSCGTPFRGGPREDSSHGNSV